MTPNEKLRQSLSEMVQMYEIVCDILDKPMLLTYPNFIKAKEVLKETEPKPNDNDNT